MKLHFGLKWTELGCERSTLFCITHLFFNYTVKNKAQKRKSKKRFKSTVNTIKS